MHFSVTFRHMDATEPLKEYAVEKLHKIHKYFPDPIQAHVVLSTEKHLHHADVNITLHNGIVLKGRETTEDMYSSVDLVMAKLERQVRKYKERIRTHKPAAGPAVPVRHQIVAAASIEAGDGDAQAPRVIKSSRFLAKTMSIDEAVMQMNLLGSEFLVFTNAETHSVNVVYRRKDGDYGLIDTEQRGS
jgi:ribosome hibernation promoting factor